MFTISQDLLNNLTAKAKASERKRINYNIHKDESDTLQRFLNATEPETYVQPHKHENPDKRELFILVRGKIIMIEFDDFGNITEHKELSVESGNFAAEVSPRTWHTIIAIEPGTISLEIKDGPYKKSEDKNFAEWAPREEEKEKVEIYKQELLKKINL